MELSFRAQVEDKVQWSCLSITNTLKAQLHRTNLGQNELQRSIPVKIHLHGQNRMHWLSSRSNTKERPAYTSIKAYAYCPRHCGRLIFSWSSASKYKHLGLFFKGPSPCINSWCLWWKVVNSTFPSSQVVIHLGITQESVKVKK